MKNRTVLLYMTFVFLSNFSTILYFLTVYLEFVGFSMVAISSMMIAYQVSKFILEVPTGYIADRFGRKTSGLVGVVGMLGYYAALLLVRSPLLLIGAFALKGFAAACMSGSMEAIYIDSVSLDQLVRLNVVERFVFYASYALSACVGGFISSAGAYLIGLLADIIAMVLTLVVVVCIPEMRRGDTTATPKRGISPKMIGAAIARNGILRSAFIMDCSQAFAFVAPGRLFLTVACGSRNECRRFGCDHCGPASCFGLHGAYCAQCDCSCRQGPFCAYLRHRAPFPGCSVFDSLYSGLFAARVLCTADGRVLVICSN